MTQILMNYGGNSIAIGQDVVQSFKDKHYMEYNFMEFFLQCFRSDNASVEHWRDGKVVILDVDCGRIINSESEFILGMKKQWQFDKKNLANRLHETLPQDSMKNCKVLMVPILDKGHWILFVIDALLKIVLIFDSNPYKDSGTDPYKRHTMKRMMASRNTKWAPTLMKRLSTALHEVRPKVGISKFGNWGLNVVKSAPIMELGSNNCGFYLMRYIESYDSLQFSVADSIQQEIPGDLRAQALSYLMFHKCNLVKDLPPAIEALRQ